VSIVNKTTTGPAGDQRLRSAVTTTLEPVSATT
jgi:hypothetical protein